MNLYMEDFTQKNEKNHANSSSQNGFFGCYLLISLGSRCKGKTYIGYTVNPSRRINQHNSGSQHGGAKSTSGKGPWIMSLIVHGFPNEISALRFEWAWQNPYQSRRLPYIPPRTKRETPFQFRFRILCHMLRVGPWNRLGLTIRWLKQEYMQNFPPELLPPLHMPIAYGPIETFEQFPSLGNLETTELNCQLCNNPIQNDSDLKEVPLRCPIGCANGFWHVLCLARNMVANPDEDILSPSQPQLLPLIGRCPACHNTDLLWPELLAKQQQAR